MKKTAVGPSVQLVKTFIMVEALDVAKDSDLDGRMVTDYLAEASPGSWSAVIKPGSITDILFHLPCKNRSK